MHPHSPLPLLFPYISDRLLASLGLILTLLKLHLSQLKRQSTVLLTNPLYPLKENERVVAYES